MTQSKAVQLFTSAVTVAVLGLSANTPATLAASGDVNVYVQNSCYKNITVWYELIDNNRVQKLESVRIAPGAKEFIKSTPYRWFRAYAKVSSGGYDWEGSGREYFIDGKYVRMREYDLNEVASGTDYKLVLPCSNL